ncbi:alpha/beta hydrolase [Streptacidiphilus sp. ASG 303]|uniref:alpha/beta fold hydrolase n=1 Tax=Streptacidiphilus sp. ASG 303 TaxID=2896847 RepID=UPI001E6190B7|nr:alpha/beta hydrolase [Streptacidiphilus sp. ASG 303]MCD0486354.1 alpha/beta hydrolase [Streptacidiphilus sp. ASG 303]
MNPSTDHRPRSRRALPCALAALALVSAVPCASAVPAAPVPAAVPDGNGGPAVRPTVVLVHGAFADASSWNPVIRLLQRDGYRVVAPANPLRGLAADSAYLAGVLRSIKGPVVLVGHSYGGAVVSGAAAGNPAVKSLVFVSAFMPDKGEALGPLAARFPGSELNPALLPVPTTNGDGTTGTDLYIKPDMLRRVFAADLSGATTAVMAATQRPIDAAAFAGKATAAAWRTIPSWAVVATRDKAIPPELERFEARRAHARTTEIDSSHVPMLSHPEAVERVIVDAARSRAADATRATDESSTELAATGSGTAAGAGTAAALVAAGTGLVAAARRRRTRAHRSAG